jgi:hypothetical protein
VGVPWLPTGAGLVVTALVVVLAYLLLMRILARLIDERFDPTHDWREAERKAETMLGELLPPEQLQHLNQRGYIEVPSPKHAGRMYRIPRYQGPIAVYESGVLANLLCVRSVDPIPNGDAVLMHKLMIEGSEDEYLKIANPIRPRPYTFTV